MDRPVLEAAIRNLDGMVVIDLVGEISAPAEEILNQAYDKASQENPSTILFNFSKVEYINSTGIALILNLLVRARRSQHQLFAYGLSDHYRELFQITRLADFMRIFQDEASAAASV